MYVYDKKTSLFEKKNVLILKYAFSVLLFSFFFNFKAFTNNFTNEIIPEIFIHKYTKVQYKNILRFSWHLIALYYTNNSVKIQFDEFYSIMQHVTFN